MHGVKSIWIIILFILFGLVFIGAGIYFLSDSFLKKNRRFCFRWKKIRTAYKIGKNLRFCIFSGRRTHRLLRNHIIFSSGDFSLSFAFLCIGDDCRIFTDYMLPADKIAFRNYILSRIRRKFPASDNPGQPHNLRRVRFQSGYTVLFFSIVHIPPRYSAQNTVLCKKYSDLRCIFFRHNLIPRRKKHILCSAIWWESR